MFTLASIAVMLAGAFQCVPVDADMPASVAPASSGYRSSSASLPPVTSPTASKGQPIWHQSLEDGWNASRKTGLPMVIFITSENCVYCQAMEKRTWCNDSIAGQLVGRFIPIHLKKGRNDTVLSRIQLKMYPTTLLATPEGKVVQHRDGFQPPENVLSFLNQRIGGRTPSR
ncbi:thioredoxin family protein [Crateriforma spongiae]|uniref:thioredoxin family protein n=1 Tax=Crateriforma spongiae TaxID=2724528 RepID=UPI0014454F96|nr:thioredoxin family protein [Crateriforma spongiae]